MLLRGALGMLNTRRYADDTPFYREIPSIQEIPKQECRKTRDTERYHKDATRAFWIASLSLVKHHIIVVALEIETSDSEPQWIVITYVIILERIKRNCTEKKAYLRIIRQQIGYVASNKIYGLSPLYYLGASFPSLPGTAKKNHIFFLETSLHKPFTVVNSISPC